MQQYMQDGMEVTFLEVVGMEELNDGRPRKVKNCKVGYGSVQCVQPGSWLTLKEAGILSTEGGWRTCDSMQRRVAIERRTPDRTCSWLWLNWQDCAAPLL